MSTPVLRAHRGADGLWRVLAEPLFTSRDLLTVESLAPFQPIETEVQLESGSRRLTVYAFTPQDGWVRAEDAGEVEEPE